MNQRGRHGVNVLVFNKSGKQYLCGSIKEASDFVGVSTSTIINRCNDGYAIQVGKGYAVRVRRVG